MYSQIGGGKCTLCGSLGTSKRTCPDNPTEGKINYSKHPICSLSLRVSARVTCKQNDNKV